MEKELRRSFGLCLNRYFVENGGEKYLKLKVDDILSEQELKEINIIMEKRFEKTIKDGSPLYDPVDKNKYFILVENCRVTKILNYEEDKECEKKIREMEEEQTRKREELLENMKFSL